MPLDTRIPLGVGGGGGFNPAGSFMDTFRAAFGMRQAQEEMETQRAWRAQQAEATRAATEQRERQNAINRGVDLSLQEGAGDEDAVMQSAFTKYPNAVPELTKFFTSQRESRAKIAQLEDQVNAARANHYGQLAESLIEAGASDDAITMGAEWSAAQFKREAPQIQQTAAQLLQMPAEQRMAALTRMRDSAPYMQERRQKAAERGPTTVSPGQTVLGPNGQPIYTAPEAAPKPDMTPQVMIGPDGRPAFGVYAPGAGGAPGSMQPVAGGRPVPPAPRDDRLVQVMGPNGTPIWVREADAVGKPAAQAARAVTGQELSALAYYNRANDAQQTIEPMEPAIAAMGLAGQVGMQYLPNFLQSEQGQAYRQAQRAFTEARLRKESGAAIPAQEFENDAKTYFAQPGDSASVLEQKRKARQTLLDGLAFASGKAYEEFYGEPRKRGQSAPTDAGKPEQRPIPGIPGGVAEFRNGKWIRVK